MCRKSRWYHGRDERAILEECYIRMWEPVTVEVDIVKAVSQLILWVNVRYDFIFCRPRLSMRSDTLIQSYLFGVMITSIITDV